MNSSSQVLNYPTPITGTPAPAYAERETLARELSGQYQLVRLLGRGGMGAVYLARDLALHRVVAVKVLRQEFRARPDDCERFRREARTTARLSHPHIVPVHAYGETESFLYFVMKYVDGESLGDLLRRKGRLPAGEARHILVQLAGALDYAHRQGVVHRDLKPENILIERETGSPFIADFGVATLRTTDPAPDDAHRAFGTPHYMSPEQLVGELGVDGRSDLYGLGVLGYFMLTGHVPFDGRSFSEISARHMTEAAPPVRQFAPNTPPALAAAIERCLAKEPSERWRSGAELHAALSAPAAGPGRWERGLEWGLKRLSGLRAASFL
jgi:eukaryotic-like serine/threonine-protein kinase